MTLNEKNIDVIITTTLPIGKNNNSNIPVFVEEAYSEVLSKYNVVRCPLEYSVQLVKSNNPRYVLAIGSVAIDSAEYQYLRSACNDVGALLVFWLHDDPYEFDYSFKACLYADIILTNDIEAVNYYDHPNAYFLPLGTSKRHCYRTIEFDKKKLLSFFCGVAYKNRIDVIKKLDSVLKNEDKKNIEIFGDGWPSNIDFCNNIRLSNQDFCNVSNSSFSTLNIGRQFNIANSRFDLVQSSPGPRTFDTAMAGSMQFYFLTENSIGEYFVPDKEIILFDSVKEVVELFERVHDDPMWAIDIAKNAQNKAVQYHTYAQRILSIEELIKNYEGKSNVSKISEI